ncbi:MAG: septum formation family protein [Ilumatobacteraceae bacterium]
MRRIDNLAARAALALLPLAGISGASLLVTDSLDEGSATAATAETTTRAQTTTTVKAPATTAAPSIDPMDAGPLKSIFETAVDVAEVPLNGCFSVTGLALDKPVIEVVECDRPHRYQVFSASDLPFVNAYVAADVKSAALDACDAAFEPFVGLIDDRSALTWGYNYPNESGWPTFRQVTCFLFLENEGLYTGDAEGSNY